jgi:hypothetical protein
MGQRIEVLGDGIPFPHCPPHFDMLVRVDGVLFLYTALSWRLTCHLILAYFEHVGVNVQDVLLVTDQF